MRVDYIFPYSENDWEAGAWIRGFRQRGVLNNAIGMMPGGVDKLFHYLRSTKADIVIFSSADHHMSYLLDNEEKRDFLRKLSPLTVHISGEPIVTSSIPWAVRNTQYALNVFDKFLFAYDSDAEIFMPFIKQNRASLSMFAVDESIWFSELPYDQRSSRTFFAGKVTDFGIKDQGIYALRAKLFEQLRNDNSIDAIYDPSAKVDQLRSLFSSRCAMVNLPGLGGVTDGFSRKVFECLACGTLLLQPKQNPKSYSGKIIRDGSHMIAFDTDDISSLKKIIRDIEKNPSSFLQIAASGTAEVLKNHTIGKRIDGIINFLTNGDPVHSGFYEDLSVYNIGKKIEASSSERSLPELLRRDTLTAQAMETPYRDLVRKDTAQALLLRRFQSMVKSVVGDQPIRFGNFITRPMEGEEWAAENKYHILRYGSGKPDQENLSKLNLKGYWKIANDIVMSAYNSTCAVARGEGASLFLWKWPSGEDLFIPFGRNKSLIVPDSYWMKFYPFFHGPDKNGNYIADINTPNRRSVTGKHFYIGGCSNWTHWLVDALANYQFVEDFDDLKDCTIVTCKLNDWQKETLKALGVTQPILEISADQQHAWVDFSELYVPFGRPLPERINYLRSKLGLNTSSFRRRRGIYLTRQHLAPRHRVANEEQIQKILVERGYDIVIPENLSLEEKRQIIWESDVIVAPPGSGSANFFLFSRPDAVLLQMMPSYYGEDNIPENWIRGGASYFVPIMDRCVFSYSKESDSGESFDKPLEYPAGRFVMNLEDSENLQDRLEKSLR